MTAMSMAATDTRTTTVTTEVPMANTAVTPIEDMDTGTTEPPDP
jgi:hypothetical protein